MNAMANPTRRLELLDERSVLRHRSLFCAEYDDCLDVAAEACWTSWSCEKCPLATVVALPVAHLEPRTDLEAAEAAAP